MNPIYAARRRNNIIIKFLCLGAALFGVTWLALILFTLFYNGLAGINLAVFTQDTPPPGSTDGGLRAYSAKDGAILWLFNANREFTTVNGVKASGASMDGPGAIVAGGMLFVNAGYGGLVGRPGNVLLAFGLD